MRCDCCDAELTDYESCLKHKETGTYLNTCLKCLDGLGIKYVGRKDLLTSKYIANYESYYE